MSPEPWPGRRRWTGAESGSSGASWASSPPQRRHRREIRYRTRENKRVRAFRRGKSAANLEEAEEPAASPGHVDLGRAPRPHRTCWAFPGPRRRRRAVRCPPRCRFLRARGHAVA